VPKMIPADKVHVHVVSTIDEYRAKLDPETYKPPTTFQHSRFGRLLEMLDVQPSDIKFEDLPEGVPQPKLKVKVTPLPPEPRLAGTPTDDSGFPPIRVVVNMRDALGSKAPRAPTMREAFLSAA